MAILEKISVFTPTHDPQYLGDVWQCLLAQTHQNWEWVIITNGVPIVCGPTRVTQQVQQIVGEDPRVRVIEAPRRYTGNIGALKRFACEQATGDIYVEVDHDDLLTRNCFESIIGAANLSNSPGFIYSDAVTVTFDGQSRLFTAENGWRHYDWLYDNKPYRVNASFPVTPRSLCDIQYAPDHVRAWTREAYARAGGHSVELPVADDHDLVVRTYLTGATFQHIVHPLYFHRLDNTNTSERRVKEITERSRLIRDANLAKLVAEWCRRESLPMFDLGGKHACPSGFIPVDRDLPPNTSDEIHGICNKRWPQHCGGELFEALRYVPDNSVGCFRAYDFLEHIPSSQVIGLMNFLYAKLVPGGYLLTKTPSVCDNAGLVGRGAFQDPDHKSFWSENNFWYYTDRNFAKYQNGRVACRFQTIRSGTGYPSEWHKENQIPYVIWDGMAVKTHQLVPGPVLI